MHHIGQRISSIRTRLKLTQSQLAASSKISRAYLARIETGVQTPTIEVLDRIAAQFHIPTGILLLRPDPTNSDPTITALNSMIESTLDYLIEKNKSVQ